MRRNTYLLTALLSTGLMACHNEPAFKVEGTVSGAADKMLYLEHTSLEGIVKVDSVKLDESGTFHFSGARPDSPDFYRLRLDNQVINFSVDSTETVTVKADNSGFATAYQVEGSENNQKIKELVLLQANLQEQVNKLGQSGLPAGVAQDSLFSLVNAYKDQVELMEEVGKTVKREYCHEENDEDLRKAVHDACYEKAYAIAKSGNKNKHERGDAFDAVCEEFKAQFSEEELEEKGPMIDRYYHDVEKEAMRRCILDEGKRLDGRATTEIRPIWCETSPLPGPHGSSIFTRGETQSLSTVTLGTKMDEKIVDDVLDQHKERFLLHYNFPPFSTGEAKAQRGVGRREIGHGHLAWRALKGQIPADYPYCVRVVSDILESNGSSSMATVCAGTLALMDAGVPIKKPVSGIAMGLIKNAGEDKYAVLSDILGDEDHLGDMDFKVTGTRDGITATQMDIKCDGLTYDILEKALMQAKQGREYILGKLTECIAEPRAELKPHAPRIETLTIPKEFIGAVIGPGGKIIQGMQEETGATITIEEVDGAGRIEIAGTNKKCIDDAMRMIKAIVAVPEVGEVYTGKVRSIMPYGAFVEFLPGKDGLLHISEIDWKRFETIEETGLKEGDEIEVKLLDIDPKTGKFKLSHKVLLPKPEGMTENHPKRERRPQNNHKDKE
jgi:polyribonucleotide nucleotidyltransferase